MIVCKEVGDFELEENGVELIWFSSVLERVEEDAELESELKLLDFAVWITCSSMSELSE